MALYELDGVRVELPGSGRYWVADNATVLGRVRIEDEASIWFNAVVRGDTEPITIGARANVQDGCVLHTDAGFPLFDRRRGDHRPWSDLAWLQHRSWQPDRHGCHRA